MVMRAVRCFWVSTLVAGGEKKTEKRLTDAEILSMLVHRSFDVSGDCRGALVEDAVLGEMVEESRDAHLFEQRRGSALARAGRA